MAGVAYVVWKLYRRRGAAESAAVDWRAVKIALVDVKAQYEPLIPQLKQAFADVLESGQFVFGPNVAAFEREAAEFLDVPETIGVANGTDAIVIVLDALGVGRGDEVICPSFTFYATAESIARREATPVFVDIDPVTLNLDPADVERKITARTKAILPVHLFGRPAPLDELTGFGVPIIEDAAQAFGSPDIAGTGIASTFSFYPTKNLFGLGDGGLVAVRDAELAERVRMLRFHGSKAKKTFEYIGYNSRLDEIQAAALRIFLRELDGWTARAPRGGSALRRARPGRALRDPGRRARPRLPPLRLPLARARPDPRCADGGARSGTPSTTCRHCTSSLRSRYLGYEEGALPETERAARENFSVPLWAGITAEQQERVVDVGSRSRRRGVRPVRTPFNRHRFPQLAADLAIVVAAWYLAFRLRFDTDLPVYYERYLSWEILGLVAAIKLSVFALSGFYNRWWRYVSTRDMWGAARGVVAASLVTFLVFTLLRGARRGRAADRLDHRRPADCSRSSPAPGCWCARSSSALRAGRSSRAARR